MTVTNQWPTGQGKGTRELLREIEDQRRAGDPAHQHAAGNRQVADPFPNPRRQTGQEQLDAATEKAATAWADVRRRTQGWPEHLAAAEVRLVQQHFGAEPGTPSSTERAVEVIGVFVEPEAPRVVEPDATSIEAARRMRRGLYPEQG